MHVHIGKVVAGIVEEALLGAWVLGEEIIQIRPALEKALAVGEMRIGGEPPRHRGIVVRELVEGLQLRRIEILTVLSWVMKTWRSACANARDVRPLAIRKMTMNSAARLMFVSPGRLRSMRELQR